MTLYALPLKFFGLTGALDEPPLVFLAVIPIAVVGIATEIDVAGAPVEVVAALISAAVFVVVSLVRPEPSQR